MNLRNVVYSTAREMRSVWSRTNNDEGFKANTPDGWAVDNGPVWWYGSDSVSALLAGPYRQSHSAITKATNVIVGTLLSGEWTLEDGSVPAWISDPMNLRADGRKRESDAPFFARLPGPLMWGQWIRSALLEGMGYLRYAPDIDGTPLPGSIAVLPFADVTTDRFSGMTVASVPVTDEGWIGNTPFKVLILRNPLTPVDPLTGITPGVLAFHAAEFSVLQSMTAYSAGTFQSGGVPSGYLKVDQPQLSQEQADTLKSRWMSAHGTNARSVAILNASTEYKPVAVNPVDAALADMTRLMLVAVANAFSVPYALLAAPTGDSLTYSTLQMDLQSLDFALSPWKSAIVSTLSPVLPTGQEVRVTVNTGADAEPPVPVPTGVEE